ncbi:hypothetical protein PMAYCL1PPCAC_27647, partial [Pristionchus mayeri]
NYIFRRRTTYSRTLDYSTRMRNVVLVAIFVVFAAHCTWITFNNECRYTLTIMHNATGRNFHGRRITETCVITANASCWRKNDKFSKTSSYYATSHAVATHATFIFERTRIKYGINLALGFDFPMEIKPDYESGRSDLPKLKCLDSTCFGWVKVKGSASVPVKWKYHEAPPMKGAGFNVTFCPRQPNATEVQMDDDDEDYND